MNTEQLRAEFEAWKTQSGNWVYVEIDSDALEIFKAGYRAALQSHPIESAAREIALWAYGEVGADPELTPGLAQLLHHFGITDDVPVAMQSRDREEVIEMALCESRWLVLRIGQAYRFVPMEGCKTCEEMKAEHDQAYGLDHTRRVEGERE